MKKLLALAILLTSTFALADMTVVGSGSRYKSFFWIPVHVYDAKLSVSDPAAFVRDMADTKALDSLASMKQKSLELTFARYVEAEKVVSGFAEALTANNIADSDNMKALKKAVLDLGAINTDDVMTFKADLDTGVLTVSKG
ncbi:MAG: hypothetical protein JKY15_07030, partial [Deltaproteobacteria bacterium]|nr:hypothetical protein [Deltaproteobacteria bacterium]